MEEFGPDYYDEDYYRPGKKSGYNLPYTWAIESGNFQRKAMDIIAQYDPDKILDVGCAKGFLVKALVMLGMDAYGIDISDYAIGNCEPEVKERVRQCWLKQDTKIPYDDDEFDLVISESVMEHISEDDISWVMRELARVSSRWVVLELPVGLTWENQPKGDPSHKTYRPPCWWISQGYEVGLLCDIRRSSHTSTSPIPTLPPYQDAYLMFRVDGLDQI